MKELNSKDMSHQPLYQLQEIDPYCNLRKLPHPFPYQGSKRGIAKYILPYFPSDTKCLIEPFCGAGAISIAAAAYGMMETISLNDLNKPLMDLWVEILERPKDLCDEYERLWSEQHSDRKSYFLKVRDEFNIAHKPCYLLYLLARIVKGSIRYSSDGKFNQSADNRRSGMKPHTMRQNILGVSALLAGKTSTSAMDFQVIVERAGENDLVYMDPPYQGTSFTRDHRYINGLSYDDFVDALAVMNKRNISYIISYDGITGERMHGKPLPKHLRLQHTTIYAGRSSQATLLGKNHQTIESLYLSDPLVNRLRYEGPALCVSNRKQQEIIFA
ncbi:MAG: DNA adenine methylase [Candidatus Dadabacteria bacterium]|nr:DNA adenine methylase [Candidatus Dadabacteria bacterium]